MPIVITSLGAREEVNEAVHSYGGIVLHDVINDRFARKAVEKAKGVLMKKLKISEAEAFRWIQKTAMDRRLGMREVADAVVAGMDKA